MSEFRVFLREGETDKVISVTADRGQVEPYNGWLTFYNVLRELIRTEEVVRVGFLGLSRAKIAKISTVEHRETVAVFPAWRFYIRMDKGEDRDKEG